MSPKPPEWDTSEATAGLSELERVNAVHSFFIKGFEHEMCDLHAIEAEERDKFCGRMKPPEFIWKQACGKPYGRHPAASQEGRQWRLVQRRLEDISLALGRGMAIGVHEALVQAAVAIHESAKTCGHDPMLGYITTGRWRGLMALGLMSQALAEAKEAALWSAQRAVL